MRWRVQSWAPLEVNKTLQSSWHALCFAELRRALSACHHIPRACALACEGEFGTLLQLSSAEQLQHELAIVCAVPHPRCHLALQLWGKFRPEQEVPKELGANRDWNIDLVPKFIIANGKLVHALVHTGVTRYMDFKAVDGSYVLKKNKISKVPATDAEALTSELLGLFEKRRVRSFFQCAACHSCGPPYRTQARAAAAHERSCDCILPPCHHAGLAARAPEIVHVPCRYVQQYDETNPNTYKTYNLLVMTMDQLYEKFGLAEDTIEFIGHAIPDVAYRRKPALPTVKRIALYYHSLTRFAGLKSPYIYPLYGLGELPQVRAPAALLTRSCDTRVSCVCAAAQHAVWLSRGVCMVCTL